MHIHTYIHVHICAQPAASVFAWTCRRDSFIWDGVTANVQGAVADKDALHFFFVRRNQTTFRTSNARTSLYPRPAVSLSLYPQSPLLNIPQNSSRALASAVLLLYTDQMNRVHSSEEALRRFTMAPCVVVERLEGKQQYSRAAISEHTGIQARE